MRFGAGVVVVVGRGFTVTGEVALSPLTLAKPTKNTKQSNFSFIAFD